MVKTKIIFTDTNKVFGLFMRVINHKEIDNSIIVKLIKSGDFEFVISTFVLQELINQCHNDGIDYDNQDIDLFFEKTNIKIEKSQDIDIKYNKYVLDADDAQIVQDAVDTKSKYILTHNIKDFARTIIQSELGIYVISDILDIEL